MLVQAFTEEGLIYPHPRLGGGREVKAEVAFHTRVWLGERIGLNLSLFVLVFTFGRIFCFASYFANQGGERKSLGLLLPPFLFWGGVGHRADLLLRLRQRGAGRHHISLGHHGHGQPCHFPHHVAPELLEALVYVA